MLIEVLVSILIFSFGILGTVALYARAVQYSTNAEDRSRAALLANEIVSAMWLRGTNNPANVRLQPDYDAWKLRVDSATAESRASGGNGIGLPGGVGLVTLTGNIATVTVTWTPTLGGTSGGTTQKFVTQVTM
jgi:type IV pilus assembly protein PilV